MKLRMPRRRTWRVAIYSISFLLVLTAADMILVQMRRTIHPGYDTTRITAPLQPDGSIDYLLAVDNRMSAGVTPENNAAVLLLQGFARQGPVRAGELLNALLQQPDGRLPPPAVFRFVPIPYEPCMRSVNQSNDRLLDILQKADLSEPHFFLHTVGATDQRKTSGTTFRVGHDEQRLADAAFHTIHA